MEEVVSPRGVTYHVTCHQWLRKGLSSILTLPTICVHRCRVWQVSLHASTGSAGQRSACSPCCILKASDAMLFISFPIFSETKSRVEAFRREPCPSACQRDAFAHSRYVRAPMAPSSPVQARIPW